MKLLMLLLVISTSALCQERKLYESDYVNLHCKGQIEFVLPDKSRVDCLADTHAIEYDYGKKWAEAIGQSLYYSAMTGKKAGIVLIVSQRNKDKYMKRVNKAIEKNNLIIDVWSVERIIKIYN